ncbi:MAG: hypothetical protein WDW36_003888 [Sanguina aurantia]
MSLSLPTYTLQAGKQQDGTVLHLFGGGQVWLHQAHATHLSLLPVATQQDIACELCWAVACKLLPPLRRLTTVQAALALPRLWQLSEELHTTPPEPPPAPTATGRGSSNAPDLSVAMGVLLRAVTSAGSPSAGRRKWHSSGGGGGGGGSGSTWHLAPTPACVLQVAGSFAGVSADGSALTSTDSAMEMGMGVERWGKVRALSSSPAHKWPGVATPPPKQSLSMSGDTKPAFPGMHTPDSRHAAAGASPSPTAAISFRIQDASSTLPAPTTASLLETSMRPGPAGTRQTPGVCAEQQRLGTLEREQLLQLQAQEQQQQEDQRQYQMLQLQQQQYQQQQHYQPPPLLLQQQQPRQQFQQLPPLLPPIKQQRCDLQHVQQRQEHQLQPLLLPYVTQQQEQEQQQQRQEQQQQQCPSDPPAPEALYPSGPSSPVYDLEECAAAGRELLPDESGVPAAAVHANTDAAHHFLQALATRSGHLTPPAGHGSPLPDAPHAVFDAFNEHRGARSDSQGLGLDTQQQHPADGDGGAPPSRRSSGLDTGASRQPVSRDPLATLHAPGNQGVGPQSRTDHPHGRFPGAALGCGSLAGLQGQGMSHPVRVACPEPVQRQGGGSGASDGRRASDAVMQARGGSVGGGPAFGTIQGGSASAWSGGHASLHGQGSTARQEDRSPDRGQGERHHGGGRNDTPLGEQVRGHVRREGTGREPTWRGRESGEEQRSRRNEGGLHGGREDGSWSGRERSSSRVAGESEIDWDQYDAGRHTRQRRDTQQARPSRASSRSGGRGASRSRSRSETRGPEEDKSRSRSTSERPTADALPDLQSTLGHGSATGVEKKDSPPVLETFYKHRWVAFADAANPVDKQIRQYEMDLITLLEGKRASTGRGMELIKTLFRTGMTVPLVAYRTLNLTPFRFLDRRHPLDAYAHALTKHIASHASSEATIPALIKAQPYPGVLYRIMRPAEMYHYRNDVFKVACLASTHERYLTLTEAGLALSRSEVPDISARHRRARERLVEAEVIESRGEQLDSRREKDIEVMEGHVAPADWNAFQAAVEKFCRTVTKKIRQGGGRITLTQLKAEETPEALQLWLEGKEKEVSWFVCTMLARTYEMCADGVLEDGTYDDADVYFTEVVCAAAL